jgi:hypothetical protein
MVAVGMLDAAAKCDLAAVKRFAIEKIELRFGNVSGSELRNTMLTLSRDVAPTRIESSFFKLALLLCTLS